MAGQSWQARRANNHSRTDGHDLLPQKNQADPHCQQEDPEVPSKQLRVQPLR